MRRQHVVLLIGALGFAALVLAVLMLGDDSGARRDSGFARRYQAPAWLHKAGAMFAEQVPRIALPAAALSIDPGASLGTEVGSSDAAFRSARLRLKRGGGVDVDYADLTPGGPQALRHQVASLPHDEGGDPMQTSIIAMKQGGRLMLHCRGSARCVLTAQ